MSAQLLLAGFLSQVRASPQSIALTVEDGRSFSYAELDALAEAVAEGLLELLSPSPASADLLVSITMRRSVGMVAGILGILKAGAAYVPVDPSFPPERQAYIVRHSCCQCAVVDGDPFSPNQPPPQLLPTLVVDSRSGVTRRASRTAAPSAHFPRSSAPLAYVLYTSGSTGNPKGVMVRQDSVVNVVDWFARELHVGPGKKVLGLTTFCFDISVLEMFMPLLHGATLVLAFSSTQKDPFRLLDILQEYSIDVLQATPTTFEMLLAAGWTGDAQLDLLIGGEAFRPTLLPLVAGCRSVRNVYGPTETTIWSSSYTLPPDIVSSGPIPIGSPISATDFYLASEADVNQLAPPGQEGELCIGGVGVARGYLNAPDLTKDKFIPCPYPGGRGLIYRTGDIVKRLPDSDCYVFVRRMDDQVQIDGFRIELAEIEQVYMQQPRVEQAVALVRGGRLVVYLEANANDAQLEQVRAAAAQRLPHYMMPKATMLVARFPQTANGKLDKKALPDPPDDAGAPSPTSALPSDAHPSCSMEAHVSDVLQAVRGRRPAPHSSFAALGVDSLGAVLFLRVLSESVGGARIRPAEVYAPGVTVSTFARALHARLAAEDPATLVRMGLPPSPDDDLDVQDNLAAADGQEAWEAHYEASLSDCVASNARLLEGMRGVFTFLVLWEHFHYESRTDEMSPFFSADTSLFVVFSGLTTALQLREPPAYRVEEGRRVLLPRPPFRWGLFLVSRAAGIFPILYLALLLNSPWWVHEDSLRAVDTYGPEVHLPGVSQTRDSLICSVLYVTGLNCWYRPQCRWRGPNNLLYASIIWSIFIFYVIIRSGLRRLQDAAMAAGGTEGLRDEHEDNVQDNEDSAKDKVEGTTKLEGTGDGDEGYSDDSEGGALFFSSARRGSSETSWQRFHQRQLPSLAFRLSYNRPKDFREAAAYAFAWLCLTVTLQSSLLASHMKNGLMFLPYFVAGVGAASIFECFYFVRYKWRMGRRRDRSKSPPCNAGVSHETVCDDLQSLGVHWRPAQHALALLWRVLPDLMAVACGVLMSTLTPLLRVPPGIEIYQMPYRFLNWGQLCGIQLYYTAFGVLCLLHEGSARGNLSRTFLESPPVTLLGYVSYGVYLFQRAAFDLWLPMLVHLVQTGQWQWVVQMDYPGYTHCWSRCAPTWMKFLAVVALTFLCWVVQRFFQDRLITALFVRFALPAQATRVERRETELVESPFCAAGQPPRYTALPVGQGV